MVPRSRPRTLDWAFYAGVALLFAALVLVRISILGFLVLGLGALTCAARRGIERDADERVGDDHPDQLPSGWLPQRQRQPGSRRDHSSTADATTTARVRGGSRPG